MVNQVLHHLGDDETTRDAAVHRALTELARVLKPGAALVIGTCSAEQLRHGFWHCSLIPRATRLVERRYVPLDALRNILEHSGFVVRDFIVPTTAVLQGPAYFDPTGPLRKDWRDGDSIWALVTPEELDDVCRRIQAMLKSGEAASYVEQHDARRLAIGQVTFVYAVRT
jgi:SAM-dependent methyltransferase